MRDDDRAEAKRERRHTRDEITKLLEQADSIERDFSELPAEDELADYDTDLLARQLAAVESSAEAAVAATSAVMALLADAEVAAGRRDGPSPTMGQRVRLWRGEDRRRVRRTA